MGINFNSRIQKLSWAEVRDRVISVNPNLAKVIDDLNPSEKHFFIKCSYPYGSKVLQETELMIPTEKIDTLISINNPSVSQELKDAISYNLNSNPVSLVLRNSFEIYLPLQDRTIPLLSGLIPPGSIFGTYRVLNPSESFQPKFLWEMTAGNRSIFMIPKITSYKQHLKLKKTFDLNSEKPKSLIDHWSIFKEITQSPNFSELWDADILFFSKGWFEHLNDKSWISFYYFLYKTAWKGSEPWRNLPIWNLIFSLVIQNYQGKPSAYICDTVKYLIHVGVGAQPGFAPLMDNTSGPISAIQQVYSDVYGLKDYPPIIMGPAIFNMKSQNPSPIYYSLQFPISMEFGKSSRERTSNIQDLHEIKSLLNRFASDITSNKYRTKETPIHDLFSRVDFSYFHNNVELHSGMKNSSEIPEEDPNFLTTVDKKQYKNFPGTCSFAKGCIKIAKK